MRYARNILFDPIYLNCKSFWPSLIVPLYFQVQHVEVEIEDDSFIGMPFVLVSGGNWIKNNGSDFFIEFSAGTKKVQKVALCFIMFHNVS